MPTCDPATMLVKEYRICMPLTTEEVSSGTAGGGPVPPSRGEHRAFGYRILTLGCEPGAPRHTSSLCPVPLGLSVPSGPPQYRVGQLYTISKHSHQESEKGEGVEVVRNEPHEDPVHGPGQFTEKRVHLSR